MSTVVVISEFMDAAAVERIAAAHETLYRPELVDDPDALAASLASARALIVRNRTQVRKPLLEAAPALEIVGRLGVGLDNIDMDACAARRVTVRPAIGANADAVAEYVIAAALMLRRGRAFFASQEVAAGAWPRSACQGAEIGGATLGLLGYGDIARRTARRAAALGMAVIAHDPMVEAGDGARLVPFETLLAEADVLSLHVPLTDATRDLIGAAAIARMKPGAIVVNSARGGVVDEDALVAALKEGRLGGAALDVFADEPLDEAAGARFAEAPNLLLSPHIAGVTHESNTRVSAMIADVVLEALA